VNLPRITLPWIGRRRDRDAVVRRSRRRGAHPAATPRSRTTRTKPGPRTVVGGALTVLALSATTATAATVGPAEAGSTSPTEQLSVTAPTAATTTALDPVVVVSDEGSVAQATEALDRATTVTEDHATLTRSAEAEIVEQADEVADLLAASAECTEVAASRSADREPPTARTAPDATAESVESTEEPVAQPADAAEEPVDAAVDLATGSTTAPDPSTVFPADGTGALVADTDVVPDTEADATQDASATEPTAAASEDLSAELADATESLTTLLDDATSSAVAVKQAPEEPKKQAEPAKPKTPAEALKAESAAAKKATKNLEKYVESTAGAENGQIPGDALSELKFAEGEELRTDAARQLERLDNAYRAQFGEHLTIRDSYRSYESQVAVKASRGSMAAVPGYSNHGWGVAVDINGGVESFGTAQYEWLRENGPKFGWDNPDWARAGARKPEAWHWEYTPMG
jgi:D-alanyl-D-alanine carboxypeptidase